jgi:hypothetical protein
MITIKASTEPGFKWCMFAPIRADRSIVGGTYYEDLKMCMKVALHLKEKYELPYFRFVHEGEEIQVETDGDIMQIMLMYGFES